MALLLHDGAAGSRLDTLSGFILNKIIIKMQFSFAKVIDN